MSSKKSAGYIQNLLAAYRTRRLLHILLHLLYLLLQARYSLVGEPFEKGSHASADLLRVIGDLQRKITVGSDFLKVEGSLLFFFCIP